MWKTSNSDFQVCFENLCMKIWTTRLQRIFSKSQSNVNFAFALSFGLSVRIIEHLASQRFYVFGKMPLFLKPNANDRDLENHCEE